MTQLKGDLNNFIVITLYQQQPFGFLTLYNTSFVLPVGGLPDLEQSVFSPDEFMVLSHKHAQDVVCFGTKQLTKILTRRGIQTWSKKS